MGKCAPQTFPNFTSECIQNLRARLQAEGLDPNLPTDSAPSGKASRSGFEISWVYDSAAQSLTVECTASPALIPCALINARIKSLISSCYPAATHP